MIDISDKVEATTIAVFEAVQDAAMRQGISFFVVGATARDMMLRDAHGVYVSRATLDVDIAIRVANWNEYEALASSLISAGTFTRTKQNHRLLFKGGQPVDVIPFGPIGGEKHTIAWPPSEDTIMGVLGFEEAFRFAETVTLRREPQLDVLVATLAGLAIMKLISWDESYPGRGRDGEDFFLIANGYIEAGHEQRLSSEDGDLMNVEMFDRSVAGARMLGRDMRFMAAEDTREKLTEILSRESDASGPLRLVSDALGSNLAMRDRSDEILRLIRSVLDGLFDERK